MSSIFPQDLVRDINGLWYIGTAGNGKRQYDQGQYQREEELLTKLHNLKTAVIGFNMMSSWVHETSLKQVGLGAGYCMHYEAIFDHSEQLPDGSYDYNEEDFEHLDVSIGVDFDIDEIAPVELLESPTGDSRKFLKCDAIGYQVEVHPHNSGVRLVWQKEGSETYEVEI